MGVLRLSRAVVVACHTIAGNKPATSLEEMYLFRRSWADWVIWSSEQAHSVDALAAEGDEGRGYLR